MSIKNLLETSTVSFGDSLGNSKTYSVPPYQRDYSWGKDYWEDLWNDIIAVVDSDSVHYMGSVVLQAVSDKQFHVIDGQQRFTTLTLIVLAIINKLKGLVNQNIDTKENEERILLLQRKYIGDKDPASLTYYSKLKLNENNDSFFQTNLLVFRPPVNENILHDSDKLLWQAFNYFSNRIAEYFQDEKDGAKITNFLDKQIAEKLVFIQIVVENELSAYTVFETLNSRGLRLTVTDLLKNYLFSITTKADLPHVKNKWKRIVDVIGLDRFPVFLRHFWIAKNKLIRQEYLFRAIKDSVNDSGAVINLLDNLEKDALLYNALSNYSDNFWGGDREIKKRIKELTLFKEKQAFPLLMAAYNKLDGTKFVKLLKIISTITFRYTVIAKRHTNLKEEIYNKVAMGISNNKLFKINDILKILKPLYLSDKEFKNDFALKSLNTKRAKKIVRYVLFAIENHISKADFDYEENPATIEHILPEKNNENYSSEFSDSIHESFVYRFGNYTLLEDEKNRMCEGKSFDKKKEIYKTSQYKISQKILENEWTPNTLDRRQLKLADYAVSIWRLSQYD